MIGTGHVVENISALLVGLFLFNLIFMVVSFQALREAKRIKRLRINPSRKSYHNFRMWR